MLDPQYVRDHQEELRVAIQHKQMNPEVVDVFLRCDERRRDLIQRVEAIRQQANELQRALKGRKPEPAEIEQGRGYKEQLQELEPQLRAIEEEYTQALYALPNPASSDTPIGPDETGNIVWRTQGTKPTYNFTPKTHEELLTAQGLLDTKRAVRVAGSRAYYLLGDAMLLEQALLQFAVNLMVKHDFTPMSVPIMVKKEAFVNTGYGPWGLEDIYTNQDGEGLIGTAEVPLTAFYQDEVLRESDLPIKMVGISPCFRREVGSYGKDTKGIFRVHTFTKVEQVVYTVADEEETRQWHDRMLGYSEELLQALGLHYQVLRMCTGDIGAGQRRKYDVETWFPGQNTYRETHSDSYFNDFQARRLNIRYQTKTGELKYVYTLNNTVAASPRLLAAVVENYQEADGRIRVPEVLQATFGKEYLASRA